MAFLLSALALTACATVVNDQKEKIAVRSDPSGAVVSVECGSSPVYGGVTPAVVFIERTAEPCAITVGKEGYVERRVELQRQYSRVMRANKVPGVMVGALFGLIAFVSDNEDWASDAYDLGSALGEAPGNAIDRKTGAAYKHVPATIDVRLDRAP